MTYFIVLFAGVLVGFLCGIAPSFMSLRREMREQERRFELIYQHSLSQKIQQRETCATDEDRKRLRGMIDGMMK